MGDVTPTHFAQTTITDDKGQSVPIVKINFSMNHPVDDNIYEYLVNNGSI
jgi:hypothetical protein